MSVFVPAAKYKEDTFYLWLLIDFSLSLMTYRIFSNIIRARI